MHAFEQDPLALVRVCTCGLWPDHHEHTGQRCACDTCRVIYAPDPSTVALDLIERLNDLPDAEITIQGTWDHGAAPAGPTEPE